VLKANPLFYMCTCESILAAIFTRAANNGTSLFIFAVAVHILMPSTFNARLLHFGNGLKFGNVVIISCKMRRQGSKTKEVGLLR